MPKRVDRIIPGIKKFENGEYFNMLRGICMSDPSGARARRPPLTKAPSPNKNWRRMSSQTVMEWGFVCFFILHFLSSSHSDSSWFSTADEINHHGRADHRQKRCDPMNDQGGFLNGYVQAQQSPGGKQCQDAQPHGNDQGYNKNMDLDILDQTINCDACKNHRGQRD